MVPQNKTLEYLQLSACSKMCSLTLEQLLRNVHSWVDNLTAYQKIWCEDIGYDLEHGPFNHTTKIFKVLRKQFMGNLDKHKDL